MPSPRRDTTPPIEDGPGLTIPWKTLTPILLGLMGGGGAQAVTDLLRGSDDQATHAEVSELHDEVVELRADVRAMTSVLTDVKALEEAAHPRMGLVNPMSPRNALDRP